MTRTYQVAELIRDIAHQLSETYATREAQIMHAWIILAYITHTSQTALIARATISLDAAQQEFLKKSIHEHTVLHKPIAYIIGNIPFGDLTINVRPPLLIPRPETESWVYALIETVRNFRDQPLTILDLCTGTGCIALALAHALPKARVIGVDISPVAIAQAQENAERNNISNVTFIESDLYVAVERLQFDLIVTNPPYIDPALYDQLEPSVRLWEDAGALIAPHAGLATIEKIIIQAHQYLKPNDTRDMPSLVVEIDYMQSDAVQKLFKRSGFDRISVGYDLNNQPRVVMGRYGDAH